MDRGKGKWLVNNRAHQTQQFAKIFYFSYSASFDLFHLNPFSASGSGSLVSIGYDDNLRSIDVSKREYGGAAISLSAQPRALEVKGDLTFVATLQVAHHCFSIAAVFRIRGHL